MRSGSTEAQPVVIAVVAGSVDLDAARGLFRAYAASLPFSLDFQGFDAELAGLPGAYAPPGGGLWLARVAGAAAGCIGLRPLAAGVGEIKRLFVAPAWRCRGIGRRLARTAVAAAWAHGYAALRLDTLASMRAARGLYTALGFRPIPAYYANPLPGAEYLELTRHGDGGPVA